MTQAHVLFDAGAAGDVFDVEGDGGIGVLPVDFDKAEVVVHAGLADAVAIGFEDVPFFIDAAGGQVMEWVAAGGFEDGEFAPVDVTGEEDHAIGLGFLDEIDHFFYFGGEVGP